jgi:hypothetical protein
MWPGHGRRRLRGVQRTDDARLSVYFFKKKENKENEEAAYFHLFGVLEARGGPQGTDYGPGPLCNGTQAAVRPLTPAETIRISCAQETTKSASNPVIIALFPQA